MAEITTKKYRCVKCGHVTELRTNHWGPTWSVGKYDTCPECPPHAKYPEYGGQTVWHCMEKAPLAVAETRQLAARDAKKRNLTRDTVNEAFRRIREVFGDRLVVGVTHGSLYRDYASFHFGVDALDTEDVYRICNIVSNAFIGMERVELSIQPGREEGNVWVQACHEFISTCNNQI